MFQLKSASIMKRIENIQNKNECLSSNLKLNLTEETVNFSIYFRDLFFANFSQNDSVFRF